MRSHLQNRVDPFGDIHAVPDRGTMMGNRGGCLHDNSRQLGCRRWASRRWIACVLSFKGRYRTVMTPKRYTELFFLDEVTALAAGHRPCFECRRAEAQAFAAAWARAFDLSGPARADEMDKHLHAERMIGRHAKVPAQRVRPADLSPGTMIATKADDGERVAWLVQDDTLWQWSFAGYGPAIPTAEIGEAELLTPPSIVAVLGAGYQPRVHYSVTQMVKG